MPPPERVDKLLNHHSLLEGREGEGSDDELAAINPGKPEAEMMQNGSGGIAPDEVVIKSRSGGSAVDDGKMMISGKYYKNGDGNFDNREEMIPGNGGLHDHANADISVNTDSSSHNKLQPKSQPQPPPLDSTMTQSPITKCILLGNHRLLLECLEQGENPVAVCSNSGRTYLHLIAQAATPDRELTWVPMVYQLSNAGADMNLEDGSGNTACGLAISRKLVQIASALMKCGAELREVDWFHAEQMRGVVKTEMLEMMRRLSPSYWLAVHDLTPFKVKRLVKAWARVNLSRNDQTLVEYAKQVARDEAIIKLLLQHEASIELAHAVMAGDKDRVRTLLCDSAVDLNTYDTSVKNSSLEPVAPLTLNGAAIKLGHVHVLNQLVAYKDKLKSSSGPSVSAVGSGTLAGRSIQDGNNPTVVFYKGRSSNEEVCQIRTVNRPVTSAMCSIL